MTTRNVTNTDLYDRLDRLRIEITDQINRTSADHKSELGDLRRQFETLEAGRLTAVEKRMNDFVVTQVSRDAAIKQNQAVLSTKFLIAVGIAIAIFNALLYGFFTRVFK